MKLSKLKAFLFDLDGVLTVGKEKPRYVGGKSILSRLKRDRKKVLILTNTSTHTQHQVWTKLTGLGFPIVQEELITSISLLSDYLLTKFGPVDCYVVGEQGLVDELRSRGHRVVDSERPVDLVAVGLDRGLTYDKLNTAVKLLRKGARLAASYMDRVYMSDEGPAFSCGPTTKALEYASGKKAIVIGKPASLMFRLALEKAGVGPRDALMIGDQLDTDLRGARKVGLHTALVLTGVTNSKAIARSRIKPDLVVNNVDELERYL